MDCIQFSQDKVQYACHEKDHKSTGRMVEVSCHKNLFCALYTFSVSVFFNTKVLIPLFITVMLGVPVSSYNKFQVLCL